MNATPTAQLTLTFHIDQLIPGISRIWCEASTSQGAPSTWLEADPCLSPWARGLLQQGETTELGSGLDLSSLLQHAGLGSVPAINMSVSEDGAVRISGPLAPNERLYGAYDADARGLDRRGDIVNLVTELHPIGEHAMMAGSEADASQAEKLEIGDGAGNYGELHLPIIVSSSGYAIYVANHRSRAILDLGASNPDEWTFSATGGPSEIYLIGPDKDVSSLMGSLGRLLGHQAVPPIWALGYIQSRFGYESFDHVTSVVDRLREEKLPVHGVVLDVQWLDEHVNLKWNQDGFADARSRIADLHERGVRVITITEPGTSGGASNFDAGVAAGAFARKVSSDEVYPADQWYCNRGIPGYREIQRGDGGIVNFFSEQAANWWYDQHRDLIEDGVDAWWLDLNEPEDVHEDLRFAPVEWPEKREDVRGDDARNVFALAQQRAFTKRDLATTDRRAFLLSRAGAAGSQRYGASPWSGDVGATWSDLQRQTHLLLSASTCGIGLWGCDIGGFAGEPGSELFARWVQLGTWLPVMRAHGCMSDREPWSQGPVALEAVRASILLRGQLLPSIASWAREAFAAGLPLTRPMWMDHPDDERFFNLADQWMFGPLLVAPVLEKGATTRTVELPRGEWVDLWSGVHHEGGGSITIPVDLTSNPAFIRKGSLIIADPSPTKPRAMQWPPSELHAWVFPNEDGHATGTFTLDDGLTRRHERGAYASSTIEVVEGNIKVVRNSGSFPMVPVRVVRPTPGSSQ